VRKSVHLPKRQAMPEGRVSRREVESSAGQLFAGWLFVVGCGFGSVLVRSWVVSGGLLGFRFRSPAV